MDKKLVWVCICLHYLVCKGTLATTSFNSQILNAFFNHYHPAFVENKCYFDYRLSTYFFTNKGIFIFKVCKHLQYADDGQWSGYYSQVRKRDFCLFRNGQYLEDWYGDAWVYTKGMWNFIAKSTYTYAIENNYLSIFCMNHRMLIANYWQKIKFSRKWEKLPYYLI